MKLFDRLEAFVEQLPKALENLATAIHHAAERDSSKPNRANSSPERIEVHLPPTDDTQRKTEQRKQLITQRWIAVGTWGAFLAASFYGCVAIRQWREMRAQTAQMRGQVDETHTQTKSIQDQFRIDQQAWLRFGLELGSPASIISGKQISINLNISNTGKSPAFGMQAVAIVEKHALNEPPFFAPLSGKNLFTAGVLFPNDHFTYSVFSDSIASKADVSDWKEGKIYIVIYGFVDYLDMFNVPHSTWFCRPEIGKAPITLPTRVCAERYNHAN